MLLLGFALANNTNNAGHKMERKQTAKGCQCLAMCDKCFPYM